MYGITKTPVDFGGPSFVGALDDLPAPAAAYSVARRLLTSYTGPLIRVRRSSDSTELDIGYDAAGDLDTAALLAFCGAGDGRVAKEYDQSGVALHVTHPTAAEQPRIVASGVVDEKNARPCAIGQTLTGGLYHESALTVQHAFAVAAYSATPFDDYNTIFSDRVNKNLISGTQGATTLFNFPGFTFKVNGAATLQYAPLTELKISDVQLASPTAFSGFWLFHQHVVDRGWLGPISEAICFPANLTGGDATILRQNQAAYYGITLP